MKKLFMAVIALMMTISASAQFYIYYSDGTVAKVDSISMIAPEKPEEPDTPTEPEEPENPSAGIGVFSVAEGKTVTFSPGNLQYTQSTNTWSFAENQYDYIGTDNVIGGSVSSDPTDGDSKSGTALADKIDLFGWSTKGNNFGVSTSTDYNDYSGSFVDWGTNKIGNDAPNTWRTLTYDEWGYLLNNRPNASSLKGVAQVNGVNGLILLPDNWTCPSGVTFKSGFHSNEGVDYYAPYQTFTADQWSKLEAAGAVFLPAAGVRDGSDVFYVQYYGSYRSATEATSTGAYCLYFHSVRAGTGISGRNTGRSVRLVKDIEGGGTTPDTPDTPTEPEEPENPSAGIGVFSVAEGKTVTFSPGNLQYTQSTTTWSFAENQYDYIGTDNVIGGSVSSDPTDGDSKSGTALADKVDLFGWSTATMNFGVSTSTDWENDYSGSFVDWGMNKIGNDAPNTWRTLSFDEWEYLLNNRPNASSLCGVAQVNGVNGLILLPDNWTCPSGVTFKSGSQNNYGVEYYAAYQTFTAAEWSKLESAGAVFLPAAGWRGGSNVDRVQYCGYYWSTTEFNSYYAGCLYVFSGGAYMSNYNRNGGRSVRLVKEITKNDTPEEPENTENGYEYVDLGLSVKWATCNVGASKPEEYGDYFAWGETEPKDVYDWSTYKFCSGYSGSNCDSLTKYNTNSSYGTVDNKTTLDLSDDAARANWGGSWRMPTDAECTELREQCTWTWTTQSGVTGYKVTSMINGNSIFLPAAGYRHNSSLLYAGRDGSYWSSSLSTDSPDTAWRVCFISDYVGRVNVVRRFGFSVRPVCQ